MNQREWAKKYSEILQEFNYDRKKDFESAKILNSILKKKFPTQNLENKIKCKTVFVIGAGPSLASSISTLKKCRYITKIVADGAASALIKSRIRPDIVVTDLDGDQEFLKKASNAGAIMVVHSHGDNIEKLFLVTEFNYCLGTTEGKPFGRVHNFGGFTDGDRCVFLAKYFGARKIILFGMDFGSKIGKYSKTKILDRRIKLKKLRYGKKLLEWLASKDSSGLYTTTKPIKGFKKLHLSNLEEIISS